MPGSRFLTPRRVRRKAWRPTQLHGEKRSILPIMGISWGSHRILWSFMGISEEFSMDFMRILEEFYRLFIGIYGLLW